ncbi:hypothetical protein SAMN05660284_02000 [Formivibrio citricus]|uniref:Uncharacterized protein n=1 Tax=Formivibrio citricus TaxID=83765 RepID=A0A1I5AUW0_9NEIS|nr:hypothetical protein [Formivibrio citricus]SFN66224.1 hypothetical protein SAMN05660284_02000 [Formivibrio citricus]
MPLYIDDEDIFAKFTNTDVIVGLLSIKIIASSVAITPALAQQLIRRYLRPLASTEGRRAFDERQKARWNSIFFLYVELGSLSKDDDNLWQLACAVELVYSHTKKPPRDLEFAPIEVNTFFDLCGYLRLPTQAVRYPMGNRDIDPLCFCTLCWRQPMPGRALCGYHAPSGPERFKDDERSAAARYKSGIRQEKLFENTVNRILTRETIEFHESSFQAQTLFPDRNIALWLVERRPAVWNELGHHQHELTDENAIQILLNTLHNPDALPIKAKALYRVINEHIQSHPALIWPMLVRAEGWYQSRELMEKNWGGKRLGAGRPEQAKTC